MKASRLKKVGELEGKIKARVTVPPPLAGWWRRYLDKTLDARQLVTLAEAVLAAEAGQLTPEADQAAEAAWGILWSRAKGADLQKMGAAFGERRGWRQILD